MGVITTKQASTNPAWANALGVAPKARKRPGGVAAMNGLERDHNARLLTLVAAGDVLWFAFNDVRLRIGVGAYFKPDFFVVYADGRIECHETKGFEREAALTRIKAAALRYPHIGFILVKSEGSSWGFETIGERP